MIEKVFASHKGTTLTEAILAVVIVLVAAASLYHAYYYGMDYIERQAHRRQALALADSQMDQWRMRITYMDEIGEVPRRPVKTVIDQRDPDTRRDDLEGYIAYGRPEIMYETVNGQRVGDYCRFWVRVYWYEHNDQEDMESVQLVSYFTLKNPQ